ncbi:serpin-Z2A-like [Lolium perenne]|uniref:serpin-Z2A-like n=1 Tax=Lolium perenne TaxID=4522 RepID=UPI0021F503A6|nr:serpin-Z2A-like [Lolium perenne]
MALRFTGRDSLTALTYRLAEQLAVTSAEDRGNLIFSPLVIYSALSLVAAGARGSTLDELLAVLGASSSGELAENVLFVAEHALADRSTSGGPLVAFASGVWHDAGRPLEPAYKEAVVTSYKAEIRAVDFRNKPEQSRKEINRWVAAATGKLIDSILPPGSMDQDTVVVLASAIYFKGKWTKPFEKKRTKVERFYLLDGGAVNAPMMNTRRSQYIAVHDGFKVLRLPYRSQDPRWRRGTANVHEPAVPLPRYSMCVFLPDAHDGLWDLVDKIASSPSFLRDHLPEETVEVDKFRLPKFKISFSRKLSGVLRDMGLKVAFSTNNADLSGMVPDVDDGSGMRMRLALQEVFHRAILEVNEEGTEAAAVTVCHMDVDEACFEDEPPVEFVADHPFAFFVLEEVSSAVVFAGHVLDPS